jgi:hypothetical protein
MAFTAVAMAFCPPAGFAAYAYAGAVGFTSGYIASNGDLNAAAQGAIVGMAFMGVGDVFAMKSVQNSLGGLYSPAKIIAHGTVGGLSSLASGGNFVSGFAAAGVSQAASVYGVYGAIGADDQPQSVGGYLWNSVAAGIVGGTASVASGGSFEQGAITASMGRLFNDLSHVMKISPALGALAAVDGPLPIGDIAALGVAGASYIYGDSVDKWLDGKIKAWFSDAPADGSPEIHPEEIAGKTPSEIDQIAREKGLTPKGPDPAGGRGSYDDPVTGKQRILSHPNGKEGPHCHVNDCQGQRLDINGNRVKPNSPEAHLPLGGY